MPKGQIHTQSQGVRKHHASAGLLHKHVRQSVSHQGDFWGACITAESGSTVPPAVFYPQEDTFCPDSLQTSTGATEMTHTEKLFSARTKNGNTVFCPPPSPQSFSSAETNGAKKGTRQHIKHYQFNPTPVPHLPRSASYPSFLWLSSLLLSVCCLWFAPSGCYCFDLLNLCNPEPNP